MYPHLYHIKKISSLLVILLLQSTLSFTQEKHKYKFESLGIEDGLPNGVINDIAQDKFGYLWFATYDGLIQYDGYDVKVHKAGRNLKNYIKDKHIFSIEEDKGRNGLWVGTSIGLEFYDYNRGIFVENIGSLIDEIDVLTPRIKDIKVDKEQNLWILINNKLYQIEIGKDFKVTKATRVLPKVHNMHSLEVDSYGNIWGCSKRNIYKVNPSTKSYEKYESDSNNEFTTLTIDLKETVWVGTKKDKILYYDHVVNRFNLLNLNQFNNIFSGSTQSITKDQEGKLWVGTELNGLYCIDTKTKNIQQYLNHDTAPYFQNKVTSLLLDHSGVLWIGTNGRGLRKLDLYRNNFLTITPSSKSNQDTFKNYDVTNLYQDKNKNIWVGHYEGLSIYSTQKKTFVDVPLNYIEVESRKNNSTLKFQVWAIHEGKRNIWIGSRFGLCYINKKQYYSILSQPNWESKLPDAFQHISLSKKKEKLTSLDNSIRDIVELNGSIWVGTYRGLYQLEKEKGKYLIKGHYTNIKQDTSTISGNIVTVLHKDDKDRLWVGTRDKGLNLFLPESKTFKRFNRDENNINRSIYSNDIQDIKQFKSGVLWVCTQGGGLMKVTLSDSLNRREITGIKTYTTDDGLASDVTFSILDDNQHKLWISTNNGISCFDSTQTKGQQFIRFSKEDGLSSNMFRTKSCLKAKNGWLYFGCNNGINVFDPEMITKNPYQAKIAIKNLIVYDKLISPTTHPHFLKKDINVASKVFIPYKKNSFSIEVAALHYAIPSKNMIRYRLKGVDKKWHVIDASSQQKITYNNVNAGDYTFVLKAANNDNLWNEKSRKLHITVGTPPWQTWWAYTLYALLFFIILYLYRQNTIRQVTLKKNLELERYKKNKAEELSQIKLNFFTNISHELRTPLTLILAPVEDLFHQVNNVERIETSKVKENLSIIQSSAKNLLVLINQLIDFRKIEVEKMELKVSKGNFKEYIENNIQSFDVLAKKKDIELSVEFEYNETLKEVWLDWDILNKITNNLLSNAIKYTKKGGHINSSFGIKQGINNQKVLELKIQDDGIGIPDDEIHQIFDSFYRTTQQKNNATSIGFGIGLSLVKSLVELHRGTIKVESKENKGTTFIIHIPYQEIDYKNNEKCENSYEESLVISDKSNYELMDTIEHQKTPKQPVMISEDGKQVILIVEDNDNVRKYISNFLNRTYEVIEASNGKEGEEYAINYIPDLIISDLMMPIMDGFELCKSLKGNEKTNHIPIIMLTAKASIESRLEGLVAGADIYLEKPFNNDHLSILIKKLLTTRELLIEKLSKQLQEEVITSTTVEVIEVEKREETSNVDSVIEIENSKDTIYENIEENASKIQDYTQQKNKEFIHKVKEIIIKNIDNSEFNVPELEKEIGMSHMQFYRKIKAITNLSANEFIRSIRLDKAKEMLETGEYSVNDVTYSVGFNSPSYFIKCFKKKYHVSPKEYMKILKQER